MNRISNRSKVATLAAATIILMIGVGVSGCKIEETEPPQAGSIAVTLSIRDTVAVTGARVLLDGRDTPRLTPCTLTDVAVGSHRISTFKPGYADTSMTVDVLLDQTVHADLATTIAIDGSVEIGGNPPDGTVLLVNNIPSGVTPPSEFGPLGLGPFRFSAYLPGHSTEPPAEWNIELRSGETPIFSPIFADVPTGFEVGDLAPTFELPSDWDQTPYRLQDYRGQAVLVTFFFYNCTACMEEFPYISAVYEDPAYHGRVQFLGVDFNDSWSAFSKFREDHAGLGVTFPLLHDAAQTVRAAYGVSTCPANFIVDRTGRIRLATGSIAEPILRQALDETLEPAHTFRFTMRDTEIRYTKRDQAYEFFGTVENLLAARRTLGFSIVPVASPDTNRMFSVCTFQSCFPPRSGTITMYQTYQALQVDTTVGFLIYNRVSDSLGLPVDSNLHGDYVLDVSVFAADNVIESTTYRIELIDAGAGLSSEAPRRTTAFRFDHPWQR